MLCFLRPRSPRWFSTGTSPDRGIHAAPRVRSDSSRSSSQESSSQRSSCQHSNSCQSHRHHRRRQHFTSMASGGSRCRTLRLGASAGGRHMSLWSGRPLRGDRYYTGAAKGTPARRARCDQPSGLTPQMISAAAFGRSRRAGRPELQLLAPRHAAQARGLEGSLTPPPGQFGWLRRGPAPYRSGTAAHPRPRPRALHHSHGQRMTLLMLLLPHEALQHLGLTCGEWYTLPIWTGGSA